MSNTYYNIRTVARRGSKRVLARSIPSSLALAFGKRGLRKAGWIRSHAQHMSVDAEGDPLPWFTYAAIYFLDGRIRPDMRVFEYGAGQSTLWWARRVYEAIACEHDPGWSERIRSTAPANVSVLAQPLDQGYAEAIRGRGPFDVVGIDGRRRNECAVAAADELSQGGVIVWDNTDRERYKEGIDYLKSHGFRRIDFDGPGPTLTHFWRTTVFYRDSNCLGI